MWNSDESEINEAANEAEVTNGLELV